MQKSWKREYFGGLLIVVLGIGVVSAWLPRLQHVFDVAWDGALVSTVAAFGMQSVITQWRKS